MEREGEGGMGEREGERRDKGERGYRGRGDKGERGDNGEKRYRGRGDKRGEGIK